MGGSGSWNELHGVEPPSAKRIEMVRAPCMIDLPGCHFFFSLTTMYSMWLLGMEREPIANPVELPLASMQNLLNFDLL